MPVSGSLVRAPWLGLDVAQLICSIATLDGQRSPFDPRSVLARVIDRFAADGLAPMVACELEFYLVERRRGKVTRRRSPLTGREPIGPEALGLSETEDAGDFLRACGQWPTLKACRSKRPSPRHRPGSSK